MQAVQLSVVRCIVLEAPEFHRSVSVEKAVQIAHCIPASVVMAGSAVAFALAFVPDVLQLVHGLGLLAVDLCKELRVDRPAVPAHAVAVDLDGFGKLPLVGCHDVHKVADGLRGVSVPANVNMHSASPCVIRPHSSLPQCPNQSLQEFQVIVVEDGADCFALLAVRSGNGYIFRELPFPVLTVPCAPGFVAVPAGGVFVAACSEVLGCGLCRLLSGDVVALDLNAEGLLLHFLNLSQNLLVHAVFLRFCRGFPFW